MPISPDDFEKLFKANHKDLCRLAKRIVNDSENAQDIVQDVFVKVWNLRDSLHTTSLKSYLYSATTNTSLNYLEKNKKTEKISSLKIESLTASQHPNTKELENLVDKAIEKLPPRCKVIFILNRFEGLRYKQIAETLNISQKTVENQMGKALRIMHEELKTYLSLESLMFILGSLYVLYHSLN